MDEALRLREAGRSADAALLYKQILTRNPQHTEALFEWACVAFDRDNYANAETLLKRLLKLEPRSAKAMSKLGSVYAKQGWNGWAQTCFEKAVAADQSYMPAYSNLGVILVQKGEAWEAESLCRSGLKQDAGYGPLYTILGKAYALQGRVDEALKNYKKALRLYDDDEVKILSSMGSLHADMADTKTAIGYYKKALALDPDCIDAHYLFARSHRYKSEKDEHLKTLKKLLEQEAGLDVQLRARLQFTLAKAYHDLKDYDRAFTHYAQGNYLVRSSYEYSVDVSKSNMDWIKAAFKKGFEKNALKPTRQSFTPIFIVGMPRSGTTLTEQILFSHPQVDAGGETIYMDQLQTAYGFYSFKKGEAITALSSDTMRAMREEYMQKLQRHAREEARYITDKMPLNFQLVGMIRLLFPEAKVIHCRRNPVDTCFSNYKHMFSGHFPFAYDLEELGQFYKSYEDLMAFWHKRLPGFIYDVQYEEMVADQEGVTKGMLAFCGLPWDPSCLEFHKQERVVMTSSALQVKKPLYKDGVESWRLYENHLRLLESALM